MRIAVLFTLMLLLLGATQVQAQILTRVFHHRHRACNQHSLRHFPGYEHAEVTGRSRVLTSGSMLKEDEDGNRKRIFHVPSSAIETDRVSLSEIAFVLRDTGEAVGTGRLLHNGGVDGGLRGSWVNIHVRGFAGVLGVEHTTDAPVVWKTSFRTWVDKARPKFVRFANQLDVRSWGQLQDSFEEITHVEIEVEHIVDR